MSLQQSPSTSEYTKLQQSGRCDTDAVLELPAGSLAAPSAAAAAQQLSALCLSTKVIQPQQPLLESFDLNGVVELIKAGRAQRIVVMAGAGISVSAGIPDFRSPGTGLYSQLQRFSLPWPEAVFDLRYFRHNPKPFCMLAKELWPGYHKHAPTPTHHFLRLLHEKGLLMTVFSQNVDGLEQIAVCQQTRWSMHMAPLMVPTALTASSPAASMQSRLQCMMTRCRLAAAVEGS
jgi:hypothetical protein